MHKEMSDQELMERFFAGDAHCFELIVERYETKVFNTALALTECTADAEAVLYEVFCSLHSRLVNDFGKSALFEWLIQYTLDTSVGKLIDKNKEQLQLPHQRATKATLREHTEKFESRNSDLRHALRTAIRVLPEPLRFVFMLRDVQGLSITKTAAILGINVFEIRSRLHEARLLIRQQLGPLERWEAPATAAQRV